MLGVGGGAQAARAAWTELRMLLAAGMAVPAARLTGVGEPGIELRARPDVTLRGVAGRASDSKLLGRDIKRGLPKGDPMPSEGLLAALLSGPCAAARSSAPALARKLACCGELLRGVRAGLAKRGDEGRAGEAERGEPAPARRNEQAHAGCSARTS